MNRERDAGASLPVACTLSTGELEARRGVLLPGLIAKAQGRERIGGGMRWTFEPAPELLEDLAGVIAAESRCCRFLRFTLTVEAGGGPVVLEVTGPDGTEEFLSSLLAGDSAAPAGERRP